MGAHSASPKTPDDFSTRSIERVQLRLDRAHLAQHLIASYQLLCLSHPKGPLGNLPEPNPTAVATADTHAAVRFATSVPGDI